jgi:hypothetical protein
MTGQGLEVGPFPMDEGQHQEPSEDQLVVAAKAVSSHRRHRDTPWGRQVKNMV